MCTPSASCCAFLHFSVQFGIDQSDKVSFKFRVFRNERVDRIEPARAEPLCRRHQAQVKLQLALRLLLLVSLQLYHLPLLLLFQAVVLLASSLDSSPDMPGVLLCYRTLRYCTVRLNFFFIFCLVFLCNICVKSIKNLLQNSTIQPRRIPWREEPGRLQSMESQRVGHD